MTVLCHIVQLLAGSLWRMAAGSCELVHTSAGTENTQPDNNLNNSVMRLRQDLQWNNHRGQRLEGAVGGGAAILTDARPWISPSLESRNQTNGDKGEQMHLINVSNCNERGRSLCVTAEKELSSVVTFKWNQTQRNNKATVKSVSVRLHAWSVLCHQLHLEDKLPPV